MKLETNEIALKLQTKWGVSSPWQALLIIAVFAVTGSLSVRVGEPVLEWLGIHKEALNPWLFWPLRILIILPIYQVLLIVFGTLAGQFKFFYQVEKRMLGRFLPFLFKD
ncbi:diacylglyceryl transferase [bacterium]|nr:diacylglyceryl transferase [bacterium]